MIVCFYSLSLQRLIVLVITLLPRRNQGILCFFCIRIRSVPSFFQNYPLFFCNKLNSKMLNRYKSVFSVMPKSTSCLSNLVLVISYYLYTSIHFNMPISISTIPIIIFLRLTRVESYPVHGKLIAASSKFLVTFHGFGNKLLCTPVKQVGRILHPNYIFVSSSLVTDVAFSQFNDDILATASRDHYVNRYHLLYYLNCEGLNFLRLIFGIWRKKPS